MRNGLSITESSRLKEQPAAKILRDNPILDRLIEVGTKALRRGLMSGETLRAPRQQLRRLRASAFDLFPKSPVIARFSGARCFFWFLSGAFRPPANPLLLTRFALIQKIVQVIQKNFAAVTRGRNSESKFGTHAALCLLREGPVA
jgi:hypothetical protein